MSGLVRRAGGVAIVAGCVGGVPSVALAHGVAGDTTAADSDRNGGRGRRRGPGGIVRGSGGALAGATLAGRGSDQVSSANAVPPWVGRMLGGLGLAGLLLVVVAGLFGPVSSARNPAAVLVFVWFWLVIPFVSGWVIDLYPFINPWRLLSGRFDRPDTESRANLAPASVTIVAFVWLEVVSQWQRPVHLALAAIIYTVFQVIVRRAGWADGDADGFAVLNRVFGSLAPLTLADDGRIGRRGFLRGLPHLRPQAGLTVFILVAIGTVSYDGARATPWWNTRIEQPLTSSLFDAGMSAQWSIALARSAGLFSVLGTLVLAYYGASALAARMGRAGTAVGVADRFAHTLVPIAFGYTFAHYFTLVVFEGQLLFSALSDPLGLGWNLLGTVDRQINLSWLDGGGGWIWYFQVGAIAFGHIAAVVLAHDRALADFEGIEAIRSQYAMMLLMVTLTGLGLVMLSTG